MIEGAKTMTIAACAVVLALVFSVFCDAKREGRMTMEFFVFSVVIVVMTVLFFGATLWIAN